MGLLFNLEKDSRFASIIQYANLITQSPAHLKVFMSLVSQLYKANSLEFQTFVSVLALGKGECNDSSLSAVVTALSESDGTSGIESIMNSVFPRRATPFSISLVKQFQEALRVNLEFLK
jgi:hypothetical protein